MRTQVVRDSCMDKGTLDLTLKGIDKKQKEKASQTKAVEQVNERYGCYIKRCSRPHI